MNVHVGASVAQGDALTPSRGARRRPAREQRVMIYVLMLALDSIAILGAFAVVYRWFGSTWLAPGGNPIAIVALPVYIMFSIAREAHSTETLASSAESIRRVLIALFSTALVMMMLGFMLKISDDVSRLAFGTSMVLAAAFLVVARIIVRRITVWRMGRSVTADLLIRDGLEMADPPRYQAMDVFDARAAQLWPDLNNPDALSQLSQIVSPYDRVVVACTADHSDAWATFLKGSDVGGEILLHNTRLYNAVAIGRLGMRDTLVLSRGPLSLVNQMQKRLFDLVLASLILIAIAPLLIATAIAIRVDTPGPVFFRQRRIGKGNRQFKIWKFRSMKVEQADADGNRSADRADDRVTRVGRFIRRTSIDELPQLFNVLSGDMSLVGPRPHALGSLAGDQLFWEVTERYWLRHALKPGITGLAQIRGFRGATHVPRELEQRLACDLEYLRDWSLGNDVRILFATLGVVVHQNAY